MNKNSALLIQRHGSVLVLSNNAAPWNRMNFEYMDALEAAVVAAENDSRWYSLPRELRISPLVWI